jgi:CheY-like chemotaxis protein
MEGIEMGKTRIFIVEDERRIARFLQIELEHEGYETATEDNGLRAFERIAQEDYDLVLLDIMLPEMDGMTICRKVREISNIPIIMLTARDDVEDKVNGLDIGADDYMTKPFAIQELLARVRNVLRKHRADNEDIDGEKLQVKDLIMYPTRYEVTVQGEEVHVVQAEHFQGGLEGAQELGGVLGGADLGLHQDAVARQGGKDAAELHLGGAVAAGRFDVVDAAGEGALDAGFEVGLVGGGDVGRGDILPFVLVAHAAAGEDGHGELGATETAINHAARKKGEERRGKGENFRPWA